MNINFPSRFLRELEIYQQIRSGQGIFKHKRLWKYEAAFLQYSYLEGHQHLSNCANRSSFKEWIEHFIKFDPNDENELNHIIANLFWRGYIDAVKRKNKKEIKEDREDKLEGEQILDRTIAYSSGYFGGEALEYRATIEGLLIGEVLSEINSKSSLLKFWSIYKYNFILDIIWLMVFWVLAIFMFGDEVIDGLLGQISFSLGNIALGNEISILFLVLIVWPTISWFYRKIYQVTTRFRPEITSSPGHVFNF